MDSLSLIWAGQGSAPLPSCYYLHLGVFVHRVQTTAASAWGHLSHLPHPEMCAVEHGGPEWVPIATLGSPFLLCFPLWPRHPAIGLQLACPICHQDPAGHDSQSSVHPQLWAETTPFPQSALLAAFLGREIQTVGVYILLDLEWSVRLRVTTKKKEEFMAGGNMLVKTWRWTSVEQGNISCITQALCTVSPRRGCF